MRLDRIDRALLALLQQDGRATAAELGHAVGLSASPAHRRQRLLEEAGVIARYVAVLDQGRVGLPINVFVSVELAGQSNGDMSAFEAAVGECPEVMECYEMTGSTDYLLRVVAADVPSYERFVRGRLGAMPGVRGIRSALAIKRVIQRAGLPLDAA